MSETSEAPPPPEVIEQPVEIPPPQAEMVPVSELPQELPPLPDAPPEFDDTPAEAPQDGGQEQVSDSPQETTATPAQEVTDEPQEPTSEAPPELDDTPADAPEDGDQEQVSDSPQETTATPAQEVTDEPQEPTSEAPPELDDTPADAPEDGDQEQVSDSPQETTATPAQEVTDEPQEPTSEAPPELDDTPADAPEDGDQEQVSDSPQETSETPAEAVADEPQEPTSEAPPELDDTPAEAPEDGDQEQVSDSPQETTATPAQEVTDEPQEPTSEAPPELDDTPAEAPEDGDQEQVSDSPQETSETPAEAVADEPQEPTSEAPPELDDTPAEAPEDGDQEQVSDSPQDTSETPAEAVADEPQEPTSEAPPDSNGAENDQAKAEEDQAQTEDDQAQAEDDQAKEAEAESEAESEAEAQAAIEAAENPPEDQNEEPAKREDDDTDDENAGDRVREHDKQPPAAGSEGDFPRSETDSEPPSYEKELMDLEVAESRELCQRIGDSYKDYDQSDLERREDGSLFFKDYQVELTGQGDAFGSYKDLQRWIGDHGMAGSRQDGCPYLEAHHLIPAAECKDAGLDPDLAPCVAVQNDLHIAMLHGSAGLTNRPEFSSVERMRAYYEGFYDGLNAATWARRAGDYLQSHNDAFKTTLAERHAALAPVAPPAAEVADRKPEHKAPLTGVATPFGLDQPVASGMVTDLPPEYTSMKEAAEAAVHDDRMPKSINGPVAYHETKPDKIYVRIVPFDPEQGLDEANFDIKHIWGKPEATKEGTTPEIAERNAQIDLRNARLEATNAELKAKTEALLAEKRAGNSTWTEVEAARVILAERAAAGEWWLSLESYGQIHEHWANTSREDPDYTLTDAFRDKLALDTKWSPKGYDATIFLKTEFPVPCVAGEGDVYHRHLEKTGEAKHGPTGIEQIFIPRSTAEFLSRSGYCQTSHDLKKLTLDQLKQTPNSEFN